MRERCYSPNCKDYKNYGARGIEVCPRWQQDFRNFLLDMGKRPSNRHSLDRINVNGPYSPDNCKWSTKIEQARNTRANVFVTIGVSTRCLSEWFEVLGISKSQYYRSIRRGASPIDALGGTQ